MFLPRPPPSSLTFYSQLCLPTFAAEVEQNTNTKKRQKSTSPNLEDFIPSEKRAKFAKKYGNLLSGGRGLQFDIDGKDSAGDAAAKKEEEEDPDSDLEILREEEARQANKAQKEQQRRELLQAKKREKGGPRASKTKSQPEETWKDRQLVARSRAWLEKNTNVQEDEDDIEVMLGDTSEEESPFPRGKFNRQNQEGHQAASLEIEEQDDPKSPDFTTAVPSVSKDVIEINVQDKAGHVLQIRVKTKRTFGKLFEAFRAQAAANVCRLYVVICSFLFIKKIVSWRNLV
jgi:hypothetical protein